MKENITLVMALVLLAFLTTSTVAKELAPNFTLTDIDGVEFSLSDYRGKVVLLDFFMILCSDCVIEMQQLNVMHQEFGDNITIVSISIAPDFDTIEKLQQFRQTHNMSWIVARDTTGYDVSNSYNIQIAPTLIIIDRDGYIQYRHVGLTEESTLQQEISGIIPEFGTWISISFIFLILTLVVIIRERKLILGETPRGEHDRSSTSLLRMVE